MNRWQNIPGQGAVCFAPDGRVRLVVNDEVADLFDQAERAGITADEIVTRILDEAERKPVRPRREHALEGRCCTNQSCNAYTYS